MDEETVTLEIVHGVEGDCISLNDYRVCGPKPWGGGTVTKKWAVKKGSLVRALKGFLTKEDFE
jgi:hypothetical protein